jgi:two-component system sensor histidine kinase DegS
LHNTVKHSNATEAIVKCEFGERAMKVSVRDNGKGFPLEQISRFGNGVLSMRKRTKDIGGSFVIDSHQGGGTKVCITVPIAISKT